MPNVQGLSHLNEQKLSTQVGYWLTHGYLQTAELNTPLLLLSGSDDSFCTGLKSLLSIPFVSVPAGIISESYLHYETFSHWMCIVSTFMLWGLFNSKFIHCADYVILLQLLHIFGTCLDWCSEFSCILRVKSHFINTRFYVCSFYIPYAKSVWSDCQHTSQIWVTACFPLVHCLFWKASRKELFGSFSQAASCCACERCIYAEPLVLHEWRRGWALKCISRCMWMQVWFQSQELLMLHQSDSQRCSPTQEDVWYLVRGTLLNSGLFNPEMLCQLRHWLRKLCFLFLKQKCSPVTDIETGSPLKFDKSQLVLAGIMAGLWQRSI